MSEIVSDKHDAPNAVAPRYRLSAEKLEWCAGFITGQPAVVRESEAAARPGIRLASCKNQAGHYQRRGQAGADKLPGSGFQVSQRQHGLSS